MRYSTILLVWTLAFFLPQYAGHWYDQHYNLYQSIISFSLIVTVLTMTDEWWRGEYATLCVLQIFLNVGDFLLDFEPDHYNAILTLLNWLELAVIVGAGGLTQLYRYAHGRDSSNIDSHRGPDDAARSTSERGRHA